MTLNGLGIAFCMFLVSESKPLDKLSAQRPYSSPNNLYMLLSVMGQVQEHLLDCLLACYTDRCHAAARLLAVVLWLCHRATYLAINTKATV